MIRVPFSIAITLLCLVGQAAYTRALLYTPDDQLSREQAPKPTHKAPFSSLYRHKVANRVPDPTAISPIDVATMVWPFGDGRSDYGLLSHRLERGLGQRA